jgi:hypothetical protein
MTGVGIEPTTYGLKGTSETAPNPGISGPYKRNTPELPDPLTFRPRKFRTLFGCRFGCTSGWHRGGN